MRSLKSIILILAILFLSENILMAQESSLTLSPKSEKKALHLSIAGTIIPVAAGAVVFLGFSDKFDNTDDAESIIGVSLAGFGIIFGPSFGHIYAGSSRYFIKGFLIRGLILGMYVGSLAWCSGWGNDCEVDTRIMLPIGLIIYSAIFDIKKTKETVRKYNHNNRLSINPMIIPDGKAIGLMLSYAF